MIMMIRYLCNRDEIKIKDTGSLVSFFSEGVFSFVENREQVT